LLNVRNADLLSARAAMSRGDAGDAGRAVGPAIQVLQE
jgi:hypothetical protein